MLLFVMYFEKLMEMADRSFFAFRMNFKAIVFESVKSVRYKKLFLFHQNPVVRLTILILKLFPEEGPMTSNESCEKSLLKSTFNLFL
uniref:Ovule protein n=1 Tax=Caenorhabditis tropicalis TaxID=1561998 RepID=A0A1I7T414_9PELO